MADNRAWTASRFVPQSHEDLKWVFERSGEITLHVDDAAQMIILSVGGIDVHVPVRRGKLNEVLGLVRTLLTSRSSGFSASEATIRAIVANLDPMH